MPHKPEHFGVRVFFVRGVEFACWVWAVYLIQPVDGGSVFRGDLEMFPSGSIL